MKLSKSFRLVELRPRACRKTRVDQPWLWQRVEYLHITKTSNVRSNNTHTPRYPWRRKGPITLTRSMLRSNSRFWWKIIEWRVKLPKRTRPRVHHPREWRSVGTLLHLLCKHTSQLKLLRSPKLFPKTSITMRLTFSRIRNCRTRVIWINHLYITMGVSASSILTRITIWTGHQIDKEWFLCQIRYRGTRIPSESTVMISKI